MTYLSIVSIREHSSKICLARDQGNDELALFKRTAYFAQSDNQAK